MKQYTVNNWVIEDEQSKFFGAHESGVVNIPDGSFTDEQIKEWIEAGTLTLNEENTNG